MSSKGRQGFDKKKFKERYRLSIGFLEEIFTENIKQCRSGDTMKGTTEQMVTDEMISHTKKIAKECMQEVNRIAQRRTDSGMLLVKCLIAKFFSQIDIFSNERL